MRLQIFSRFAFAALMLGMFAVAASAQSVTATGTITLRQADGTTAPLQGATISLNRTDVRGGPYTVRTDRNGRYTHVGLPLGTYTILISAPNARPTFGTNIRLGMQPENSYTLEPGDGRVLTLEEVRAATAAGASATAGATAPPANDEAVRRAVAEEAQRRAAYEEQRRAAEATNVRLNDVLRAGMTAYQARRYDEAIAQFDIGIQADPTQGVFHMNRAVALRVRAVDKYNTAIRASNTADVAAARTDFAASVASAERAVAAYRAAAAARAGQTAGAAPAAGAATQAPNNDMLMALQQRMESYRIALQTSTPNVNPEAAVTAIEEYVAAEPDAAKKAQAQASLGDALFQSGRTDDAIAAYRRVLTGNPNNLDAIYGLGLAQAGNNNNTEALATFRQFLEKAPASDTRRQMATQIIDSLNEAGRTQPQQPRQGSGSGRRGRP